MKKSTFSKLLKGVSASLAAAILLSACGAGGKTTDTGAGTADSTAGSTAAATSLNLAVTTGDGSSTDDKIPTPWYNRTLATNLMFRSLFLADSTLAEVKPDLAESYKVSDDGLVYTIQMKDGLKWSDGEALTADDVVWSIQTALTAAQINPNYATAFANIKELSAADGTITITLSTPYSAMAAVLAQFAILPQHSLKDADPLKMESDKFWTAPVCSGMYTLDELKPGNYFTLKVNDQYEGAAPKIPGVTVYFVADYITAAQSGKADYVFGNASDLVETLSGMPNYTANKVDVLFYKYFLFNMKGADGKENTAMQNPLVRKALIESIDRTALASLYPNANILSSGVPMTDSANNGF
nr:ABC transporter substrate-binding protein [Butyricicoccus sp. Marseille-Q5471]